MMFKVFFMFLMSFTFLSNHPMYVLLMIVTSSVISSIILFYLMKSSFLSYIIIIAFASGLMISFSYIISMIPNEFSFKKMKSFLIYLLLIFYMCNYFKLNINFNIMNFFIYSSSENIFWATVMLMMFLLVCTYITFNPLKPLKSLFYEKI